METIFIVAFAVILIFFALAVLALAWQKKALTNQQAALSRLPSVDENLEISRSALQQQKEYEDKMNLYICNQNRMIELLEQLVEKQTK